jgi:hypothetical protein
MAQVESVMRILVLSLYRVLLPERSILMSQNQQHFQRNQRQHTSQPYESHRPPPRNQEDQRREFLWRERVRLELQVQALLARGENLARQWQHLQERKAALGNQLPRVASQMVIAGLVGIRQLPSERLHYYEKERIAQGEYRLQQDIMRCQGDAAGLNAQIEVLDFELSLL